MPADTPITLDPAEILPPEASGKVVLTLTSQCPEIVTVEARLQFHHRALARTAIFPVDRGHPQKSGGDYPARYGQASAYPWRDPARANEFAEERSSFAQCCGARPKAPSQTVDRQRSVDRTMIP